MPNAVCILAGPKSRTLGRMLAGELHKTAAVGVPCCDRRSADGTERAVPGRAGEEGTMDKIQERLDAIRRDRSDVENHLIDEYAAGRISRRELFRRGTVI